MWTESICSWRCCDQDDGLVPRLLGRAGVDPDAVRSDVEAELDRRPRVSGPGRRARPGHA